METQTLGLTVAFVAGLFSFLSPCVLPLIPSYASFITGMSLEELTAAGDGRERRTIFVHGLLFVLGFTLVFLALGASATFLGSLLRYYGDAVGRVGGVLLIVFGLYLLGVLRLPGAGREWRVHLADKPVGYLGTVLVGVAFGAGWTPCIGPVLGGILTLAATRDSLAQGIGLLAVYSAGLAVPFLLATLLLGRFLDFFRRFRTLLPWIGRVSGALLVVVGILLVTGSFSSLSGMLARFTPDALLDRMWTAQAPVASRGHRLSAIGRAVAGCQVPVASPTTTPAPELRSAGAGDPYWQLETGTRHLRRSHFASRYIRSISSSYIDSASSSPARMAAEAQWRRWLRMSSRPTLRSASWTEEICVMMSAQ